MEKSPSLESTSNYSWQVPFELAAGLGLPRVAFQRRGACLSPPFGRNVEPSCPVGS